MAEFYSANLATEVRKGMTQKAKQGLWPAKAPIAHLNLREQGTAKRGTAKIVLDPERALLVPEAFRMYPTGATASRSCRPRSWAPLGYLSIRGSAGPRGSPGRHGSGRLSQ